MTSSHAAPARPTRETRVGPLACLVDGADDAPLVVCVHGFPDVPRSFDAVARELVASGRRVVRPFLPGYAPSAAPGPFDMRRVADDLAKLVRAFSPGRPAAVVGHDWGAAATYVLAAHEPALLSSAVTLSVPHPLAFARNLTRHPSQLARSWYMAFFQLPRLPERALGGPRHALVRDLYRAWSPDFAFDPAHLEAVFGCLDASGSAPIAYYRAIPRQLVRPTVPRIRVPTLHLHGERDGCIDVALADGQARYFDAECNVEIVRGAGHFVQLERPREVADRVLAWLDAHPAR